MNDPISLSLSDANSFAENNPPAFLESFDAILEQFTSLQDRSEMLYYKTKALVLMNQYTDAEQLTLELLELAVKRSDQAMIARCNVTLSIIYPHLEMEYREKACLDMAYEAAKRSQSNELIAEVLCHLGRYYQARRQEQNALNSLLLADGMIDDSFSIASQLKIKMDIGAAYYSFTKHNKAMEYLAVALELSIKLGDIDKQLTIINNLSTLNLMLHKFEIAHSLLEKGLDICIEQNITIRRVLILFNIGVSYMRQDQHILAIENFLKCKAYADEIGFSDPRYLYDLYSNLAGCYRYSGQSEEALQQLDSASEIAEKLPDPDAKQDIRINRANLLCSMNQFTDARILLKDLIKTFAKQKRYDRLIVAKSNLAKSYEQEGNFQSSVKHFEELVHDYEEYLGTLMAQKSQEYESQISELITTRDSAIESANRPSKDTECKAFENFVGLSDAHKAVVNTALLAAQHPTASILITGESGTGKDIVARIIHNNSLRREAPFIPVNMAAISQNLLESEFFGHKKGSFTGALQDTKGYFLQAHQGSLFLDEIAEMPISLQAKLLRVLESRKLSKVGSSQEISFDTRIISSTNRDILTMIQNSEFRLDLYHRLNTIEIHLPALRERPEDIPIIAQYYLEKLSREMKRELPKIDKSFMQKLSEYSFPGNIRELRNIIERLLIIHISQYWNASTLSLLPNLKMSTSPPLLITSKLQNEAMERSEIIKALTDCGGKQKDAAKLLGMSESTLTRRIVKYKLQVYTRLGN